MKTIIFPTFIAILLAQTKPGALVYGDADTLVFMIFIFSGVHFALDYREAP